jgi:hypothetical protein
MRLNHEQRRILAAMQEGCYLKIHRTLDGAKVCCLHGTTLDGKESAEELPAALVDALERHGYVQSNMKFPVATLLLTERGARATVSAQGPAVRASP